MIESFLLVLPILLKWIPLLGEIIAEACQGNVHGQQDALAAQLKGLADVCEALRNTDESTVVAVKAILGNGSTDLEAAIAILKASPKATAIP